jgi:hypothetical protein
MKITIKSPLTPLFQRGALFLPCLKHLLLVGKGRAGGIFSIKTVTKTEGYRVGVLHQMSGIDRFGIIFVG